MERERLFNGGKNQNGTKDYKGALIDALVITGFTFFSTLGGLGATGLLNDPGSGCLAAGISAGIAFFSSLMASLQIRKPAEKPTE